ncbi:MAG: SDR family oxidoreductase [Burkholderiales bacterium]|nr:SDR family oxidoreductase [Burkholderiales bacterium]
MTATIQPGIQLHAEALGASAGRDRMRGRRVLVVGAGQRPGPDPDAVGNGRAIASLLAREGAAVACADKNLQSARDTAEAITAAGGSAAALSADIERAADVSRMFEQASECLGGLDGLVVNAGIIQGTPLDELTTEIWDLEYRVNVRGPMLCCQAALRVMPAGSSAVLISSIASIRSSARSPAYETSKAALNALARTVATAGEPKGIRCNVVAPGAIDTPLGRSEARRNPNRVSNFPFGRQGTAWEVAYATLFLLSNEASYVNSQVLLVDGGLVSGIFRPAAAAAPSLSHPR